MAPTILPGTFVITTLVRRFVLGRTATVEVAMTQSRMIVAATTMQSRMIAAATTTVQITGKAIAARRDGAVREAMRHGRAAPSARRSHRVVPPMVVASR